MSLDPNYEWKQLLDIDDSDIPLTLVLHPCNSHVRETTTTTTTQVEETPVIISGPACIVLVEENPVKIIPGPAGIVQATKMLKQRDIVLSWDGVVMSTQEYIKKMVEDEDFKSGVWVSMTKYVDVNGSIVSGCLGDIKNFLKNRKLEQVVAIIKSCTLNALGDLTVTVKDLSGTIAGAIHHKVINEVVMERTLLYEVLHKDSVPSNDSGVCWNVTHQEMADEEALNVALEEEARQAWADQQWLDKCRKEAELDEEHERQLWGFYGTI
ncbi:ribonuclease H-like domain-containing protein [Tanacetum coccineum]